MILCVGLLGFRQLLASGINLPDYPSAVLIIAGILLLLVYDYVFTLIIGWYYRRVKRMGQIADEEDLKLS